MKGSMALIAEGRFGDGGLNLITTSESSTSTIAHIIEVAKEYSGQDYSQEAVAQIIQTITNIKKGLSVAEAYSFLNSEYGLPHFVVDQMLSAVTQADLEDYLQRRETVLANLK